MSDSVACDACGKLGDRKLSRIAPPGWFFAAFHYPAEVPHDPGDRLILAMCSEGCRDGVWTKQENQHIRELDRGVLVAEEVRNASWLQAKQLRDEAKRLEALPSVSTASKLFAKILAEAAAQLDLTTEGALEELSASAGNAGAGGA